MDILNSYLMYGFLISAGAYAALAVVVEPFVRHDVGQVVCQHAMRVLSLTVVVAGVSLLGLFSGLSGAVSMLFAGAAGYLYTTLYKKQRPQPE